MAILSRALASIVAACLVNAQVAHATCAIGDASRCISQRAPDGSIVQFPRLSWTTIATGERDPSGSSFQLRYLQGGMVRVTRNASAQALGIPGNQVSGVFRQPANAAPIVFARFAPGSNQLRIDVLRIERSINGRITVADAVYGPHHAERFIAQQAFISPNDRRAGLPGINPLAGWKSADDNIFHDICLQCPNGRQGIDPHTSGVATAIGVAMRQVGAQLGILAVAREWFDVQEHSSGGLLRSTVTVQVSGYAQPEWWIASPIGAQLGGTSTLGICAVSGEAPCQPEHVVPAGIQLAPWAGPGLPTDRDRLYYSESSHGGMTVLGYALLTAVAVGAGAYAWGGDLMSGGGAADLGSAFSSTPAAAGVSAGTSIGSALAGGMSYIGLTDALHPGSPGDVQTSYLGKTWSSGSQAATNPTDAMTAQLNSATTDLQIHKNIERSLTAQRKIYQGDCQAIKTSPECSPGSQGIVPRIPIKPRP